MCSYYNDHARALFSDRLLVYDINEVLGEKKLDTGRIDRLFNKLWDDLKSNVDAAIQSMPSSEQPKTRSAEDILEELVRLTRLIAAKQAADSKDIKRLVVRQKIEAAVDRLLEGTYSPAATAYRAAMALSEAAPREQTQALVAKVLEHLHEAKERKEEAGKGGEAPEVSETEDKGEESEGNVA